MPGRTRPRSLRLFCVWRRRGHGRSLFEPGPAFFAVGCGGEGALIFCLIRGMRPDTFFPLTSTKLPLYLAGGDDGDRDEGDRQRQRQRLSSAPETSSETSVGGLEILPIEIFLLREKASISQFLLPYCTFNLTPLFFFWGWVFFSLSFRRCHHPGAIKKRNKDGGLRYKQQQEYFALRAVVHLSIHFYSFIHSCYPSVPSHLGGIKLRAGYIHAPCVW